MQYTTKQKMSEYMVTREDTAIVTPVNSATIYCYESLARQTTQQEVVNVTLVPSYMCIPNNAHLIFPANFMRQTTHKAVLLKQLVTVL